MLCEKLIILKDFVSKVNNWEANKWNDTKADSVISQITAERKIKNPDNDKNSATDTNGSLD